MYDGVQSFTKHVPNWYRRNVWLTQPSYLEVLVEKEALSAIFEEELRPYGVTLNVGHGYESWSALHEMAERYQFRPSPALVCFTDFDPAGEHMVVDLVKRLAQLDCCPEVVKVALTREQVEHYQLPHDFTKAKDTRAAKHIERYGDMAVELDALPIDVLRFHIRDAVQQRMDLQALLVVERQEQQERRRMVSALDGLSQLP